MSSSFSKSDDGDIICADDAAGSPDVTLNLEAGDLEEGQIGSVGTHLDELRSVLSSLVERMPD